MLFARLKHELFPAVFIASFLAWGVASSSNPGSQSVCSRCDNRWRCATRGRPRSATTPTGSIGVLRTRVSGHRSCRGATAPPPQRTHQLGNSLPWVWLAPRCDGTTRRWGSRRSCVSCGWQSQFPSRSRTESNATTRAAWIQGSRLLRSAGGFCL